MRRRLRWLLVLLVTLLPLVTIAHLLRSWKADRAYQEKYGITFLELPPPSWLITLVGESIAYKLLAKPVYGAYVEYADDELLNYLATFSSLERILTLDGARVTEVGITKLKTLKKLIAVILKSVKVDDEAAEALATIHSLEQLYVGGKSLSNKGLQSIATLPNLSSLHIEGPNGVTEDGLNGLATTPHLERLTLRVMIVDDAALKAIARINGLKRLNLPSSNVSRTGLTHLTRLKNLESLSLDDSYATEDDVAMLQKSLPRCTIHCGDVVQPPSDAP